MRLVGYKSCDLALLYKKRNWNGNLNFDVNGINGFEGCCFGGNTALEFKLGKKLFSLVFDFSVVLSHEKVNVIHLVDLVFQKIGKKLLSLLDFIVDFR